MRQIIFLAWAILSSTAIAVAHADTPARPHLLIEPFANTYALQQKTGVDFGFNQGERFPGSGGGAQSVSVTFRMSGAEIRCDDAIVSVIARYGLVQGGRIFCSIERDRIYTEDVFAAIDAVNDAPSWRLHENSLQPLPPGVRNEYEAIYHVYRHLLMMRFEQQIPVMRSPLMSWRSDENRGAIDFNAAVNWRHDPSGKMRLEIVFGLSHSCLSDISAYEAASERGVLDRPEYEDIRHLSSYFSDQVYSAIPWEERVSLTHHYVTELCENTATW